MSQHCRANPCCGDVPCAGIPLPQHASGLPSHNKNIHMKAARTTSPADPDKLAAALKGLLAIISDSDGVSGYEPGRVTPWDEFPEVAEAINVGGQEVEAAEWQGRYWIEDEGRWSNWITNPGGYPWAYDLQEGKSEIRYLYPQPASTALVERLERSET